MTLIVNNITDSFGLVFWTCIGAMGAIGGAVGTIWLALQTQQANKEAREANKTSRQLANREENFNTELSYAFEGMKKSASYILTITNSSEISVYVSNLFMDINGHKKQLFLEELKIPIEFKSGQQLPIKIKSEEFIDKLFEILKNFPLKDLPSFPCLEKFSFDLYLGTTRNTVKLIDTFKIKSNLIANFKTRLRSVVLTAVEFRQHWEGRIQLENHFSDEKSCCYDENTAFNLYYYNTINDGKQPVKNTEEWIKLGCPKKG